MPWTTRAQLGLSRNCAASLASIRPKQNKRMAAKGPKKPKGKGRDKTQGAQEARREAVFQPEFLEDLRYWVEVDRSTALRTLELVEAILRDPFSGIGKPEPLKH